MTDTTTHATADSNMDKTIEIDSLAELSLRFIALDFALDGLYEHTKACEVEPEQVEAIDLIFRDLWKEYRGLLA